MEKTLDEKSVMDMLEKIRRGSALKEDLINLLGKERLQKVFEDNMMDRIVDNLIMFGKSHVTHDEMTKEGIIEKKHGEISDFLNLLDGKISGDLYNYYNIKPEFVLSLSEEEREHLAEAFSQGNQTRKHALMSLWANNVQTIASGDEERPDNETTYLYLRIPVKEKALLRKLDELSIKGNNHVGNNVFSEGDYIVFGIYGDDVFSDWLEIAEKPQAKKKGLLEVSVKELKSGADFLRDVMAEKDKSVGELSHIAEEAQDKAIALQQKVDRMENSMTRIKDFVVHKIGRIPFLGKRVLRMMEEELRALPEPNTKIKSTNDDER